MERALMLSILSDMLHQAKEAPETIDSPICVELIDRLPDPSPKQTSTVSAIKNDLLSKWPGNENQGSPFMPINGPLTGPEVWQPPYLAKRINLLQFMIEELSNDLNTPT